MSFWFLSDCHWTTQTQAHQHQVEQLLLGQLRAGDRLVLAGDIFDLLCGRVGLNEAPVNAWRTCLRELHARDIQITWIEGNHDFHLDFVEADFGFVEWASEGVTLKHTDSGKVVRIEHGDLADRQDRGYLMLRGFLRTSLMRMWAQSNGRGSAARFGAWLRKRSLRGRHGFGAGPAQAHAIERLRRVYRSYAVELGTQGADVVVLGHCHDADRFSFKIGDRRMDYVNLGFPAFHRMLWMLEGPDGTLTSVEIPFVSSR